MAAIGNAVVSAIRQAGGAFMAFLPGDVDDGDPKRPRITLPNGASAPIGTSQSSAPFANGGIAALPDRWWIHNGSKRTYSKLLPVSFAPYDNKDEYKQHYMIKKMIEDNLRKTLVITYNKFAHRYTSLIFSRIWYTAEEMKYKGELREFERSINLYLQQRHMPPVFVENLTGKNIAVPKFKYTTELLPSARVRHAIRHSEELTHTCSTVACKAGDDCPTSFLDHRTPNNSNRRCCLFKNPRRDGLYVECAVECSCDGNKVLQKGRQIPLFVVGHELKDWTLRAGAKIKEGELIGEYSGDVLTDAESKKRPDACYHLEMPEGRMKRGSTTKMHKALVIDGLENANETRFFSHDCEPNVAQTAVYTQLHGVWYARMAFFALRPIDFWEELTISYFPDMSEADKEFNLPLGFFKDCFCGKARCMFANTPAAKLRRAEDYEKVQRIREQDRNRRINDSFSEGSSEEEDYEDQRARRSVPLRTVQQRNAAHNSPRG